MGIVLMWLTAYQKGYVTPVYDEHPRSFRIRNVSSERWGLAVLKVVYP